MSNINGRTVLDASMHENMFVNGIGEIKKELSSMDTAGTKGVKMTIDEPFLNLEIFSPRANKNFLIAVPLTNFKRLVLSSTPKTTPPLKE
jgi:hypothetical protein